MEKQKLAGIILAAGYSSRMKQLKCLLPLGKQTVLERQIQVYRFAEVEDIYVVTGNEAERVQPIVSVADAVSVLNANYANGMFSSVQAGIAPLTEVYSGFYILPVDCPLIPPRVLQALAALHRRYPDKIILPRVGDKTGHPPLIPIAYRSQILSYDGTGGLKKMIEGEAEKGNVIYLDTDDASILWDMDTPESYEKIRAYHDANMYPGKARIMELLRENHLPAHIIAHCKETANLALAIAKALNQAGHCLNERLVYSAAHLHDIARLEEDHERVGGYLIASYGYIEVGDVAKDHMVLRTNLQPGDHVSEADVVYLADKLIKETRLVTLEKRMEPALIRFGSDEKVVKILNQRIADQKALKKHMEDIIGAPLESLIEPKRTFLIRHGEIDGGKGYLIGQTDLPLNETGKQQMHQVAETLLSYKPKAKTIYCSDLVRSIESAKIIAAHFPHEMNIVPYKELREIDLGSWDGKSGNEIRTDMPEAYAARGENLITYRIDKTAENFEDLQKRVLLRYNEILAETEEDTIFVTHAGVNRVIIARERLMSMETLFQISQKYGELTVIQ